MVITAHWINDNWKLQKKILNFFQVPDHKGETIAKGIEACLLDWRIKKPFTVILDNASVNDAAIRHLKGRIEDWKGIILRNDFLWLNDHNESITRVRNVVKYVKSSPARFASFKSFVEKVKIENHGLLSLDVETRWNSTYMMLSAAIKFEKAFSRIYVDDHKYQKHFTEMIGRGGHPNGDDWKKVKDFIKFLDIFYQIILKFSGTLHVTSNSFCHELFNLLNFITNNSHGDDSVLIDMADNMKVKFEKYWGDFDNMNILLLIAVVLDP
ncbi:zinc finger BED domain-containing protein RICESLEEPER 2-like [Nicotiana tomentosiformis]|uniref:zinc finger BED domain-containing protein RICESLEEPER 2-like n=1 Tax=Nicotiana tomentosiformis TaxID=4098 RepID=UPI00388C5495